ncbi:MAG: hypothetical protein SF051_00990 [Elusimicrobiota bacterium]|nr:hypothetical protein [Elusimicrobiota bacterium]
MTGPAALLLAALAGAAGLGGHEAPKAAEEPVFDRRAALEEMWRRRLVSPDQGTFSPEDQALLERMRRTDADGVEYLRGKPGGIRPWTVTLKEGKAVRVLLTKEGFERYRALLTQDAIAYFEGKGAEAKWVLKFTDWQGKRLFDPQGAITEAGEAVYRRASLNLEVYWKGPAGEPYGTRRPPAPGDN